MHTDLRTNQSFTIYRGHLETLGYVLNKGKWTEKEINVFNAFFMAEGLLIHYLIQPSPIMPLEKEDC